MNLYIWQLRQKMNSLMFSCENQRALITFGEIYIVMFQQKPSKCLNILRQTSFCQFDIKFSINHLFRISYQPNFELKMRHLFKSFYSRIASK